MTLFEQITDFNNLYRAYKEAAAGKHSRKSTLECDLTAERVIWGLKHHLETGKYQHGPYRRFEIHDPKRRSIKAAPFTDRIVHHAVCQIIEPLFERGFVYDSYACRVGKGTHQAVRRLQRMMRKSRWEGEVYVLRCDISKFFKSIDHDILYALLSRKVYCNQTLALLRKIIDSTSDRVVLDGPDLFSGRLTGIPIGNLTSQLFANIYLNELDQFIKHTLKEPSYIRYMDDFLILSHSKRKMHKTKQSIEEFLDQKLKLNLHPAKSRVLRLQDRLDFLGYGVLDDKRLLAKPTVGRFCRRIKRLNATGKYEESKKSWEAFTAYASFAQSHKLLQDLEARLSVKGSALVADD